MSWYYLKSGQQVGPVSWEDLFRAAQARQFGPPDMVWGPGLATWQPASTIPGLFAPPAAPAPSVAPAPTPQPAARAPRPTPGNDPVMRMIAPVGRSPWAIAAGYLGLFSLLLLPAPFAVATGLLALHDIRNDPDKHGKGRAIFGIVLGAIGTLALVALTIGLILERS
jgi:hypothetical protein